MLDDCGNPLRDASVVASFSNGDPPLKLAVDPYSTLFTSTWQPGKAGEAVTVRIDASSGALTPAFVQVAGNLNANTSPAPSLVSAGVLNNLNPVLGGALAPGTVAQVYGDNLAPAPQSAASVPLPTLLQGVEAVIGGVSAPIYYISKTQLTVQIPSGLAANQTYAAAFADGRLIAQHSDYTLVDAANPAKPGEPLVVYLVGMGATNPVVAAGSASPVSPLAEVGSRVQVTVDGQAADVRFAGLTPGGVGLYQINFVVPAGARSGSVDVEILQEGAKANATMLVVGR